VIGVKIKEKCMRVITRLICGNPGLYSNIDSNHRSHVCRTNIKL
jgi:hypothetical protein